VEKKSLTQLFHEVDPDLNVIEGGRRHRQAEPREEEIYTFTPTPMTDNDWMKAAGVVCSSCGQETFRSRDGMCMPCWEKANEFEVRDRTGALNLLPATVIMEIARPARKGEE
jgi:hypothetical protein